MLLFKLTHEASHFFALVIHLLIVLLKLTLEVFLTLIKSLVQCLFSLNVAVLDFFVLRLKSSNFLFKILLFLNVSLLSSLFDIISSAVKLILLGGLSFLLVLDLLLQVAHLFLSLILSFFHVLKELFQGLMLCSVLFFEGLSTIFQNLQLFSNRNNFFKRSSELDLL